MTQDEIYAVFKGLQKFQGKILTPDSRLVGDLGMDSQDLVGLVLEFETVLNRQMDEDLLMVFIDFTVGEICARLAG
jgi:acyl carrier protein